MYFGFDTLFSVFLELHYRSVDRHFFLSELAEELAGARNLKIGIWVSNDISTKEFEWLRKIFTPSLKKVTKCLSLHMTRLI